MDIKLISLDLDGTLLDSEKRLSPGNVCALKACISQGVHVVPTTGRAMDGIPGLVLGIPGIRYAITANGAIIFDLEKQCILDSCKMPVEKALGLIDLVASYRVVYNPYVDGRGITEPRFYDHMEEYGMPPEIQEMVRMTRDVHPDIRRFVESQKKPVEKFHLYFDDLRERDRLRRRLEKEDGIVISSSMPMNLEVNASGATKGKAILRLAAMLGLGREQTMAIGDGENDFTMICEAGLGIAMGNSHPRLLEFADYVTGTCDQDGVAAAIWRFVIGQE